MILGALVTEKVVLLLMIVMMVFFSLQEGIPPPTRFHSVPLDTFLFAPLPPGSLSSWPSCAEQPLCSGVPNLCPTLPNVAAHTSDRIHANINIVARLALQSILSLPLPLLQMPQVPFCPVLFCWDELVPDFSFSSSTYLSSLSALSSFFFLCSKLHLLSEVIKFPLSSASSAYQSRKRLAWGRYLPLVYRFYRPLPPPTKQHLFGTSSSNID